MIEAGKVFMTETGDMVRSRLGPAGDDVFAEMRGWRRHLHAHPELSHQEFDTTVFIRSLLDQWGLEYSSPLGTATVASVRGEKPGPVLVIRADIDGLPIQEQNQVSYASQRPGVMHACGHDGHTAILLGLARVLSRCPKDRMRGEVRLLFQPAEESTDSGAKKLVAAGVVDDATAVVGIHLRSTVETGTILLRDGTFFASDDQFEITITGNGGHAGHPHQANDALVVAAGLVGQLQTLISRRIAPLTPAVVTVGTFNSGEVYSAIAGVARLSGTVRTLSPESRDFLQAELVSLATAYAAAHHTVAEVKYTRVCPPVINEASAVEFVRPAAEAAVGAKRVVAEPAGMGGEDFAFYSEVVPGAFAVVGASNGTNIPHHHPRFDINEDALDVGLRYFYEIVQRWCNPETVGPDIHFTPVPPPAVQIPK